MITSEILEKLNESTFIGRSRIDGYPMYKIHLGNRPHTKGLNTVNVKYNEADKINPIILIKEIEYVKEYQSIHGLVSDGIVGPMTCRVLQTRNEDISN